MCQNWLVFPVWPVSTPSLRLHVGGGGREACCYSCSQSWGLSAFLIAHRLSVFLGFFPEMCLFTGAIYKADQFQYRYRFVRQQEPGHGCWCSGHLFLLVLSLGLCYGRLTETFKKSFPNFSVRAFISYHRWNIRRNVHFIHVCFSITWLCGNLRIDLYNYVGVVGLSPWGAVRLIPCTSHARWAERCIITPWELRIGTLGLQQPLQSIYKS